MVNIDNFDDLTNGNFYVRNNLNSEFKISNITYYKRIKLKLLINFYIFFQGFI